MRLMMALSILLCLSPLSRAAGLVDGLSHFHVYDATLATSAQPKRGQFTAIADAGYKVIINVAAPESNPDSIRDEKELAEKAGMQYYFFPISWEKPDVIQVVSVVKLLEKLQGTPTLVHCYINARASLVAYLLRSTGESGKDVDEKKVMTSIWKQNSGYEFENSPQWQRLLEDAKIMLMK
jgi:protein tyrosine phosphatase (PTP) superfamily phosphohydrolase (DUF442 family)